ncbi:hypothetical protein RJT34_12594 [Clitoria ternatea]|uniref:protein-serine/threonine phosphatase n=1 Tax=Clitoria ternatea TaxID=43366 RepID=A0AAN9JMB4_CLITE
MSCSVAVPSSPVFPLFFNNNNNNSISSSTSDPLAICIPNATPSYSPPSSPLQKRKRPTKLHIPVGHSLTFEVPPAPLLPTTDTVEVDGNEFSVYCKRGRRQHMEDRYSAAVDLHGKPKQAFFGIFDGHGGTKASEYAAHNLEKNVLDEVIRRDESDIEEAVKHGYLNTDSDFLKEDLLGGSCCVTALIRNGNLVVSNVGDCRAVISSGGVAEALTSDHKPSREDERDRIETQGGYVDMCRGVWRIQGSLAVSRGIGDRHLKQWVIAEPETRLLSIQPQHDLLILASDGLWEKVSNQEAVDIARPLCVGNDNRQQQSLVACKTLVDLSVSRGSVDDISVMIIQLQNYI